MRRILCAFGLLAGLLAGTPAIAQGAARLEPGHLTDDQLRIVLQARGYSDLAGFERGGDTVRVAEAKRYGEGVGTLQLDPKTGQVLDERPMDGAQIRAMLGQRGFDAITDVMPEGDGFRARARRDGSAVEMRINPRTGAVTPQGLAR